MEEYIRIESLNTDLAGKAPTNHTHQYGVLLASVQNITFSNSQSATVTVGANLNHCIPVVESGVAMCVMSCTCTNTSKGEFYIVLNAAYTGTLKITFYCFSY